MDGSFQLNWCSGAAQAPGMAQPRRPARSWPSDTVIPSPALFKGDWVGKFAVLNLQLKEQAWEAHPVSACWWVSSCSCGGDVQMGSQH